MKEELLKKAESHGLGVEDIINISRSRNLDVANALQEIKIELNWPCEAIEHEKGTIIPPMGTWVDIACEFITKGYDGLLEAAHNEQQIKFIVPFLQEYKFVESVNALLQIAGFTLTTPETIKIHF